jgi:hypothetical protein
LVQVLVVLDDGQVPVLVVSALLLVLLVGGLIPTLLTPVVKTTPLVVGVIGISR